MCKLNAATINWAHQKKTKTLTSAGYLVFAQGMAKENTPHKPYSLFLAEKK